MKGSSWQVEGTGRGKAGRESKSALEMETWGPAWGSQCIPGPVGLGGPLRGPGPLPRGEHGMEAARFWGQLALGSRRGEAQPWLFLTWLRSLVRPGVWEASFGDPHGPDLGPSSSTWPCEGRGVPDPLAS